MARFLLHAHEEESTQKSLASRNPLVRLQGISNKWFENLRAGYREVLQKMSCAAGAFPHSSFWLFALVPSRCFPGSARTFFPAADAGQIKLHLRAPTATRIEETAARAMRSSAQSLANSAQEIASLIDNIGLPYSAYNYTYSTSAPIGPEDADIMISLAEETRPTDEYIHDLRLNLAREFPGVLFYFPPADIVSQILNFACPPRSTSRL